MIVDNDDDMKAFSANGVALASVAEDLIPRAFEIKRNGLANHRLKPTPAGISAP